MPEIAIDGTQKTTGGSKPSCVADLPFCHGGRLGERFCRSAKRICDVSVGYLTGVYQHIGDRFTQLGDQAPGFGTVDLAGFKGDIGGPYTQSTFTFNPKLPAYDIVNLRLGILMNFNVDRMVQGMKRVIR